MHKSDHLCSAFVTLIAFPFYRRTHCLKRTGPGTGTVLRGRKWRSSCPSSTAPSYRKERKRNLRNGLFVCKKPKIDFSIFTKTVRYRDTFLIMLFSKFFSFFQWGVPEIRIRSVIGINLLSPILHLGPADPCPRSDPPFSTEKYVHFFANFSF